MRLMVFFDLPTRTPEERKVYQRFRNFLLKDGYHMIQFSVYARICGGMDRLDKHMTRLKANLPDRGHVRCMSVTEKQYAAMQILLGEETPEEKQGNSVQLVFFDDGFL
ncbi:MAG: CRISPR-associated endonuclease Cas2 [Coriobacteriia bacterium]